MDPSCNPQGTRLAEHVYFENTTCAQLLCAKGKRYSVDCINRYDALHSEQLRIVREGNKGFGVQYVGNLEIPPATILLIGWGYGTGKTLMFTKTKFS